jgi:hypothetical protein
LSSGIYRRAVYWRFRRACCLHHQGQRISQIRNHHDHEAGSKQSNGLKGVISPKLQFLNVCVSSISQATVMLVSFVPRVLKLLACTVFKKYTSE